jgi:hypothetical protein
MLYRVFRAIDGARMGDRGSPLYVPREQQGAGRHDRPDRYGAFYAAFSPEAAAAEAIQAFRGRDLSDDDFVNADDSVLSLAVIEDDGLSDIVDLDDPSVLLEHGWRPSSVASRVRPTTQSMAVRLFDEGALGLSWWSTIDAGWTNVTLFAERAVDSQSLQTTSVERLDTRHPNVIAAADRLAIPLTERRARRRRR